MTNAAFIIPGDIDLPTGGYAYDRRVLERLPAHGVVARHVAVPGSFPHPSGDDVQATCNALKALPQDTVLLFDGLAYGAMPEAALRTIGRKVVALCHHPLALETGLDAATQSRLLESERAALAFANHTITTSALTKRLLIADFGLRDCGITVAEPGTDRAQRARGHGSPLNLLAVGSIVPRKGYHVLVDALARLREHHWMLTVVGAARDATTLSALQAQIAAAGLGDRIQLVGPKSDADLSELYQLADLFVMPSLFEGYGMVLAEAMARGLPIVCTTGGAAAETAPDSAALKVPPGDALHFGEALTRVMTSEPLRRQMADASWSAALSLPTWDDTTKNIAAVLHAIGRAQHGTQCA